MKREEAIKLLNDIHSQCCDTANILCTLDADKRCDALQMAITALQNQPVWIPVSERLPKSYRESEPYKQTKVDEIRSMTDKELAMELLYVLRNLLKSKKICGFIHDYKDCTLAWLQKESEEQ